MIIKAIGSHPYRLEVPEGTRCYNIVHTALLKSFRRRDKPLDLDEEKEKIWEVK